MSERDLDLMSLREAGEDRADRQARLGELLEQHRGRLLRMVNLRMDRDLRARIGAPEVLQESWLEVSNRLDEYLENPQVPFYVWIRFLTAQRLLKLQRFHSGAPEPAAGPEAPAMAAATSVALVDHLLGAGLTPSLVLAEDEFRNRLENVLGEMNALDREVLVLRHFEEMSNAATAQALDIDTGAASERYLRALEQLTGVLERAGINPSRTGIGPTV